MTKFYVLFTTAALAGSLTAHAQTFHSHPIKVAGGSNVVVAAINTFGEMVVNYTDATGMAHCQSINGSTITEIADPNEIGTGSGAGTSCYGVNDSGQIVGSYSFPPFGNGFLYESGTFIDIVVPSATAGTTAYGLNGSGSIVGSFADNAGQHGFLYDFNSNTYTTLDVPGAAYTLALDVNDSGEITFEWLNDVFVYSGAILKNGHYRVLNVPGMTQSKARKINAKGWIDFNAQDGNGVWHGFLYKNGTFTQFDVAGAANTFSYGINLSGQLTGGYNPSPTSQKEIGFEGSIH